METGDVKLAYRRAGKGPLIVFAHGAAEDSRLWQAQLDGLADEFTVIVWDEPGAGRSGDLPAEFSLADFADHLAALIRSLQLGPAHIAGHSWGGTIVLELYRRHPDLVATLILIDTYAGWKGSLPAAEVRARINGARQMLAASESDFDPSVPGVFAGAPPAGWLDVLAAVAADVRPATLQHELTIMAEADLSDLLPHIAVPTLLIWGELDIRSPLSVARQFQEAIPNTELHVISGAGHESQLEQPDQLNTAVRAFCRAHSPRSSNPETA